MRGIYRGRHLAVFRDDPLGGISLNSLIVTVATVVIVVAVSSLLLFHRILRLMSTLFLYTKLLTTLMVPLTILLKSFKGERCL